MEEVWTVISGFPEYKISSYGQIINLDNGKAIRHSHTAQGARKVGLSLGGVQYTRSVKVLVAEAFVSGRSEDFDTPIQLDGNQDNVWANNLMWRPRWFAWKYARQFHNIDDFRDRGRILDIESGEVYHDIVELVTTQGLLLTDVWRSIRSKKPIFPTGQVFEVTR